MTLCQELCLNLNHHESPARKRKVRRCRLQRCICASLTRAFPRILPQSANPSRLCLQLSALDRSIERNITGFPSISAFPAWHPSTPFPRLFLSVRSHLLHFALASSINGPDPARPERLGQCYLHPVVRNTHFTYKVRLALLGGSLDP